MAAKHAFFYRVDNKEKKEEKAAEWKTATILCAIGTMTRKTRMMVDVWSS